MRTTTRLALMLLLLLLAGTAGLAVGASDAEAQTCQRTGTCR